ncbi:GH25 family lysozyme, partial [Catenulispora pinisilvae]|uniref:GH25 family lysozyme n=1 Tax=Catenulispora pinisilvae TaxID=2705253 RepID=UPI0022653B4B
MTVFFPDISSYEAGLVIQPGTVAVIAKATEGTYYRDAQYQNFKDQAARVGAVFSAYHFLKAGNGAAQAEYCFSMVGATPVMLDVETEGDSKPGVADCLDFIVRMRSLGGRVWGAYFPRWFWEQVGGNLAAFGVAIVASGYPGGYSDTDPNWNSYGGTSPLIWQYTDAQPYGGQHVDFNAYRGTTAQLADLINGTSPGP